MPPADSCLFHIQTIQRQYYWSQRLVIEAIYRKIHVVQMLGQKYHAYGDCFAVPVAVEPTL